MTNQLIDVLQDRASRADRSPDVDLMLADVQARVADRAQHRRAMIGAGAASVAVAAVTVVVLAVTGGGGQAHRRVGNPPAAPINASTTRPASPSASTPTPEPPTTPGLLTAVTATPSSAPSSLALIPAGYQFLGATTAGDITTYGPARANHDPQDWQGKLVILTARIPPITPGQYTATIIGRPAAIMWNPGGGWGWIAIIKYSPTIQIDIQIPISAPLTRAQVQQMLNTLTVRDVSNPASG